ncbi:hypothetical protein ENKNEFLB_01417 [Nocardioides aquaticus]|uniref:Uncharacterized protein n=1 Tax=Nocardioides aquaticus TaxID=160826 RepID=A0ABX8EIZ9_9ACTN|nr:hypothetical protein [Nocardioides aquaticus]QVT79037.1 hypothetical protein ENKNEFLB_01417 [Nocardioides aquaticus]
MTDAPSAAEAPSTPTPVGQGDDASPEPRWWHRDHPTFTALAGFFTGLVTIIVVPGLYAGLLSTLTDTDTAETLFPFVLLVLVVPIGLSIAPRTRRFGLYLLLGMVSTAVVMAVVAALVLLVLVRTG